MKILHQEVIYSQGCFLRVKRWIKGWVKIPNGKYIIGLTGRETEVVVEIIRPKHTFFVL